MTVKELIEALKNYPEDLEVYRFVPGFYDDYYDEIYNVKVTYLDKWSEKYETSQENGKKVILVE
jgi:hypothetical protein